MSSGIKNIFKGKYLVSEGAYSNWAFIVFCALLALVMIGSSHSAERKVYQVAELNQQLKELRSEFVDTRKTVMQLKMESNVAKKMKERSIGLSDKPPYKITVKSK
jgi:hypothetical protein